MVERRGAQRAASTNGRAPGMGVLAGPQIIVSHTAASVGPSEKYFRGSA
jgi:hypothetical protein